MKKYLLFIISFVLLFSVLQIGSGIILTLFYTPEITSIGTSMHEEVEFGNSWPLYLIATLLVASIVFFLSQKFTFTKKESSQMKVETLIRILEENMSFKLPENFQKARGKILVTVGEKEKAVMKKSAMDIVKSNPNCTGIILSNIGHGVPLANPTFFNRMIDAWIDEGNIPNEGKTFI